MEIDNTTRIMEVLVKKIDDSKREISTKIDSLAEDISDLKEESAGNKDDIKFVKELRNKVTPNQVDKLVKDVGGLQKVKNLAVGALLLIQVLGTIAMFLINKFVK